jgi:hypothetical protein
MTFDEIRAIVSEIADKAIEKGEIEIPEALVDQSKAVIYKEASAAVSKNVMRVVQNVSKDGSFSCSHKKQPRADLPLCLTCAFGLFLFERAAVNVAVDLMITVKEQAVRMLAACESPDAVAEFRKTIEREKSLRAIAEDDAAKLKAAVIAMFTGSAQIVAHPKDAIFGQERIDWNKKVAALRLAAGLPETEDAQAEDEASEDSD